MFTQRTARACVTTAAIAALRGRGTMRTSGPSRGPQARKRPTHPVPTQLGAVSLRLGSYGFWRGSVPPAWEMPGRPLKRQGHGPTPRTYRLSPMGAGPRSLHSNQPLSVTAPRGTAGMTDRSQGHVRFGIGRPSAGSGHAVPGQGSWDTQKAPLPRPRHAQLPGVRRVWVQALRKAACSCGALRATAHNVQAPCGPLPQVAAPAQTPCDELHSASPIS